MANQLSQADAAKFKQAFQGYAQGDGTIATANLGALLKSLGQDITQGELQDTINEIDAKGTKKITLDQFLELMARRTWEQEANEEEEEAGF